MVYTPHSLGRVKKSSVGIGIASRDRIEARILDKASAIHALSEDEANAVKTLYGRKENVWRIPHGVNRDTFFYTPRLDARRALGWDVDAVVFLFVGRFEPQKNLRRF